MKRYEALIRIIHLGSFSRAASELGYSQSAISKMITSLEEEFDVKLIVRSRYGIRLTPEGEQLFPYIQSLVSQHQTMQTAVNDIHGLTSGTIRIGAFASISIGWLVPLVREFWKVYPGIQFDLIQADYSSILEMVEDGRLDLGFVNRHAAEHFSGISCRFLRSDEFKLVLPKEHPLAEKKQVGLEDLRNERFLMIRTGNREKYNDILEAFKRRSINLLPALHVDDDYTILSMVEQGVGISILSEKILRAGGRDVVVRSLEPPIIRDNCMITDDPQRLPASCRKFISFIMEHEDLLL